jgi:flagella basal body P-ring formation protein FlgA
MNTRTLTPFLVSLLLGLGATGFTPAARAQNVTTAETAAADPHAAQVANLLADVAAQLSAHFHVDGELQLESVRALALPESSTPLQIDILEFPASLASAMILRVRIPAAADPEQTLVLRARQLRDVWVTRAPSVRDAAFVPSELDSRQVDVLRDRESIPVTELCADYSFCRTVSANRVLTWRDIARRPLVRKGQLIEVAAVDGSLSITMKAMAMENGAEGETVKVRNIDSKKEFSALVVSDARALVRF